MQTGLLCYSDDSACLTPDYQLAGMPFALALREAPRFRPSNLDGASPVAPPVALIFVNYEPTAETTTLDPIATFEALVEIQKSGFWVEHTQPAITQFLNWLAGIPRYKLTYSDLTTALPTLTRLLADHTRIERSAMPG